MHDHLLSLRSLSAQGAGLSFGRAFLSWHRERAGVVWTGTVRAATGEGLPSPGVEVELHGETLDGRSIEGRAFVRRSGGSAAVLELEGRGPLVVAGRAL